MVNSTTIMSAILPENDWQDCLPANEAEFRRLAREYDIDNSIYRDAVLLFAQGNVKLAVARLFANSTSETPKAAIETIDRAL